MSAGWFLQVDTTSLNEVFWRVSLIQDTEFSGEMHRVNVAMGMSDFLSGES